MPELSPETRLILVDALDKPTLLGNPLDVEDLQRMKPEGFDRWLQKFFEEANFDMLRVRLNLPEAITPSAEKLYTQIAELSKTNDKRVFVLTRATEPPVQVWYDKLNSLGLTFTGNPVIMLPQGQCAFAIDALMVGRSCLVDITLDKLLAPKAKILFAGASERSDDRRD